MLSKTVNPLFVLILLLCGAAAVQASPRIIYVDAAATGTADGSSWKNACKELQDALTAAADANKPVEIRVAAGTYKPIPATVDRAGFYAASFQLIKGVALKGGYAGSAGADPNARDVQSHATILSGQFWDGSRLAQSVSVVTASGTDATAVIEGFTLEGTLGIEDANPTVTDSIVDCVSGHGGPGVVLTRCKFAWIRFTDCNCVMSECSVVGSDDTLAGFSDTINCSGSDFAAKDCTFSKSQGRVIYCTTGNVTAANCTFTGNLRGSIHCTQSVDLTDCSFTANGCKSPRLSSLAWPLVRGDKITARGCRFTGNVVGDSAWTLIEAGEVVVLVDCEFVGNDCRMGMGMVLCDSISADGCIFAGNAGGALSYSYVVEFSNCTFVGNRPGVSGRLPSFGFKSSMKQCILWDSPRTPSTWPMGSTPIPVTYCDVRGGMPGLGNIDADPCFVDPGHWDPNGTPDNLDDDFWVAGDYHLKSQAGHWDANLEDWICDDVTSPCIDAGDPNAPVGDERFPNGGYIDIGAYGGTAQASRTYFGGPVCPAEMAGDVNGDCKVDDLDMAILMQHWLMEGWEGPANKPPTIRLISPEEGAVITAPTPVVLRVDASDVDGAVITVRYRLTYSHDDSVTSISLGAVSAASGWETTLLWSGLPLVDGVYAITAMAVDDNGARAFSDPITVTLHPSSK